MKLLLFFLLVCSRIILADSVKLEGVWVLDKSMTEESLRENGVALPSSLVRNLENSYESLAYVFKGNRTTYTPKDTVDDQPNWYSWKTLDWSNDSVTILISGLDEEIRFSRKNNCLGLLIENYHYSEYYCLQQ